MSKQTNRFAAVLAGGVGRRFWPLSREKLPKQLLAIIGRHPMLVETVNRLSLIVAQERTFVITTASLAKSVRQALPDHPAVNIVVEPVGRNTAAACGYGCLLARQKAPEAVVGIFPIDAYIRPVRRFRQIMARAFKAAEAADAIVLVGVKPTFPATGYGYLKRGDEALKVRGTPVYQVARFKEKPTRSAAARFLKAGTYFWNSGIFVARAEVLLEAIDKFIPALGAGLRKISQALGTARQAQVLRRVYAELPAISLDQGVLEKASTVLMVEADFQWDDVGNWLVLERVWPRDVGGNLILGAHLGLDTEDSIIVTDTDHLIATVGVDDLIVVHTDTATLVAHKRQAQRIRELVELMKKGKLARYR